MVDIESVNMSKFILALFVLGCIALVLMPDIVADPRFGHAGGWICCQCRYKCLEGEFSYSERQCKHGVRCCTRGYCRGK